MTIQTALDLADQMKPNMMKRETKLVYLTEIEQVIHGEVIMKHEHTKEQETKPKYDGDTDPGTELLIPDPYSMLYVYWIMSKVDLQNLEMDKYNNDRVLFENAYENMGDWYTRNHMPLQAHRHFRI
jgi:hypothetical protein